MQSQIDWGQARVWLGAQREVRHIFVLTLGFSRRSFYVPCLSEAFRDDLDFNEQLQEWMATVADVRVQGTTHERQTDRFAREREELVPAPPGRAFRLEAPLTRVVATDYLVTVDTNRYSVPFTLIGQPVEVMRRNGSLQMRYRGQLVATHPVLGGRHQLRSLPEHGPGPILNWFRAKGQFFSGVVEGFNGKARVITKRAYGFRTCPALEVALYHALGDLPEPQLTHRFC